MVVSLHELNITWRARVLNLFFLELRVRENNDAIEVLATDMTKPR